MGRIPTTPQDAWQAVQDLATEVDRRIRASHLGHMTARGGASNWADSSAAVHVTVGDLGDGTNGVSTDGRIEASGAVSAGSVSSTGALSGADHNASSNVPTVTPNGVKIFVQATDPGAAANNGDIWINTS